MLFPFAKSCFATAALLALCLGCPALHAAADPPANERALLDGRLDDAISSLRSRISTNPRDAAAQLLLCRAYFAQDSLDPAVAACEAALANGLANDSTAQDWMGRAYGRKADSSGPITGFQLAKKVRAAFERAVDLDPRNPDAINDLSEYYVGAPAIVGGGLDKAEALAKRVEHTVPSSCHRTRALASEKSGDYARAEAEFRAAIREFNTPPAWVDLAGFFFRRHQPDAALSALRRAIELDTTHDASLADVASILNDMHREPELAERTLREYIAGNAHSDAAPLCKAYTLLGRMLAKRGDKPGARQQFQAALALASTYTPARKALQSL